MDVPSRPASIPQSSTPSRGTSLSKQLAQVAEGKRIGLVIVLVALLAALAAVGSPMWSSAAHAQADPADTLCPGLYHVNPDGTLATGTANGDCTPAAAGTNGNYDVDNNVIGYTHEVCAINTGGLDIPAANPFNTTFEKGTSPLTYYFHVTPLGSGPAAISGTVQPNDNNINYGSFETPDDVVCATWTATAPGDQQVTLNAAFNNNPVVGAAGTANCSGIQEAGQAAACTPLIKEWNLLAPTTITTSAETSPSTTDPTTHSGVVTNTAVTGTLTFNPDHSSYDGSSATYYENVWGQHTSNQGTQAWYLVAGATVTFTNTSTGVGGCGVLTIGNGVNSTDTQNTSFIHVSGGWNAGDPNVGNYSIDNNDNTSVTVTSVGVPIPFHFSSNGQYQDNPCTQPLGANSSVSITVSYPSAVGSQNPTFPAETLTVNYTNPPQQTKQVLLAWVGQRIIIEHDWRVPAGDSSTLTPAGACAFGAYDYNGGEGGGGDAYIEYDKQDGPGGFIGGLQNNTYFSGGGATTVVDMYIDDNDANSQADTVPDSPQSACISRALFESDSQGQVDITAYQVRSGSDGYTRTDNQSTMAWVVYYMNLNTVNTTIVDVSKPTHNSSASPDWTPANPWDASAETATTTSNISKDVLVRGRVTGWFTNSIPSGRAADSANHLPADRWVMPDDWATLAGGANSSFRPSFDLMFAPSNTGMALTSPSGNLLTTQLGVALTGSGTGAAPNNSPTAPTAASPILVTSSTGFYVGQQIWVGPYTSTILAITPISGVGYGIFLTTPIVAPVAGTPIYGASGGVPFEGPYSLIDIQGLASNNGGNAGAALSNIAGTANSATRDTTQGDGTVDWWDAPMPSANISVAIRGTGFIKQVIKSDVYYLGAANSTAQTYPNPYYISNIPASPFIPAAVAGSHYLWDSWGPDGPAADNGAASSRSGNGLQGQGPYQFWEAVPNLIGQTSAGVWGDPLTNPSNSANAKRVTELNDIRADYGNDPSIARDLVVFSDNHGEFMVAANGDFLPDLSSCATNSLGGGQQCAPGDAVGTGTVTAVADYPDFVGQSIGPVASNATTIDWTWGGYKSVSVEKDPAGNTQYVYLVFHALDRDGHCSNGDGAVLLHPVLTALDTGTGADTTIGNQVETVDFKIDAGDGIVIGTSGGATLNDGARFATGVPTYSLAASKAGVTGVTKINFPMDASLAAEGQTDECQAWIKISNSLLGQTNVLTIAHEDGAEGNIGFDKVLDFQTTQDYTLNFRWTLFTWAGKDGISVTDALKGGSGVADNAEGNDISDQVTAVYGWQPDSQTWLGYFPSGADIPGANNLTSFSAGQAYWIAIKGPGSVTWTITTNVS